MYSNSYFVDRLTLFAKQPGYISWHSHLRKSWFRLRHQSRSRKGHILLCHSHGWTCISNNGLDMLQ